MSLLRELQLLGVEAHAIELHVGQDLHQWHLDIPEQTLGPHLFQTGLEHVFQSERYVGVLRRILVDLLGRQVAHVLWFLPFGPMSSSM